MNLVSPGLLAPDLLPYPKRQNPSKVPGLVQINYFYHKTMQKKRQLQLSSEAAIRLHMAERYRYLMSVIGTPNPVTLLAADALIGELRCQVGNAKPAR